MATEPDSQKTSHQITTTISNPTQEEGSNPLPPNLPCDIIVETLSRLPVKSLLRYTCVSKLWGSLISSPQFAKTHLDISTKNQEYVNHRLLFTSYSGFKSCSLHSLLYEPSANAIGMDCPMHKPGYFSCIIGSCNGLLCIASCGDCLFLWNPSTRRSFKVPYLDYNLNKTRNVMHEFGYDETSDDYKVVRISDNGSLKTEVNIYSLRTDTWRRIGDFPGSISCLGKFANGALHWRLCSGKSSKDWVIVSLDLANDAYGEVEQPNYEEGDFVWTLEVSGRCLSILCDYGTRKDIWVMKDYGKKDSWTKIDAIPFVQFPWDFQYAPIFCIPKKDELVVAWRVCVALYSPKYDGFRVPKIHNVGTYDTVQTYIESLVSLDAGGVSRRQQI